MADKKKSNPDLDANSESDVLENTINDEGLIDADAANDGEPESSDQNISNSDDGFDPDVEDELDGEPEDIADPDVVEDTVTPEPEPIQQPAETVERVIEKRGGFAPALIGGVVAAGLGFFAARSDVLDAYLPSSFKGVNSSTIMAALDKSVTDQTATLTALSKKVSEIKIPDQAPVLAKIDAFSKQLDALKATTESQNSSLSKQLSALDARLTKLEKQPVSDGVSGAAIDAYERELTQLQAAISKQRADVESLVKEARQKEAEARALDASAVAAAKVAANQTILAKVHSALDAGAPFGGLLSELQTAGVTVPDALLTPADAGVSTMFTLRETFPPAARAALDAARSDGDTKDRGVNAFLERYLGARSVEPREGNDPDAILSRAEAALKSGHLSDALADISALPEPAQAALADWIDLAKTRMAALNAADALAQSLKTN